MSSPVTPYPACLATFSRIVDALRFTIGWQGKGGRPGFEGPALPAPRLTLIWARVCSYRSRLFALVARIQAGKLRKPPMLAPRALPEDPARMVAPKPRNADVLPRGPEWLARLMREARSHGGQIAYLINHDAEMQGLIAAAPLQMGRILRPLLRMLGQEVPACLRAPERPAASTPRLPRPRAARPSCARRARRDWTRFGLDDDAAAPNADAAGGAAASQGPPPAVRAPAPATFASGAPARTPFEPPPCDNPVPYPPPPSWIPVPIPMRRWKG